MDVVITERETNKPILYLPNGGENVLVGDMIQSCQIDGCIITFVVLTRTWNFKEKCLYIIAERKK